MVKIDWSQETGFSVSDVGMFSIPGKAIEQCLIAGILHGRIDRDDNGTFSILLIKGQVRQTIAGSQPGFDGIIKALNGHDWTPLIEEVKNSRFAQAWTDADEFEQLRLFDLTGYDALVSGKIGTWSWYARTYSELYPDYDIGYRIDDEWHSVIDHRFRLSEPAFYIGKALDKGYAREKAIKRNGTASLWLKGYKRKSVVGMELFYALAVLGIDVVVYEQRVHMPLSAKVMDGDDLCSIAGDYIAFEDVEATLFLNRLCGKHMNLDQLNDDQIRRLVKHASSARFAKNLHSEVAANLEMVLLSCKLLKLKGLIQGPSLAEALCSAAGVELSAVELILNGHKRKYLPHAIWAVKTPLGNAGSMPAFAASINGMSLSKLPESDLVNHYIGDLTGCCQHLDGAGKRVCKEGWKVDYNCNYVFRSESGNIIAHMWVWLDSNGNLVVDSVEARSYASVDDIARLMRTFAQEMAVKGHKVLIRQYMLCIEEDIANILSLDGKTCAGETLHGKEWSYSDTEPGDECYIVE